ncbi:major facilitator superfamily domain-containing protein [Obelidium mucronatum]|nr:major facilitator superfamily domain-containing protein [Obelidium mucronatum]
MLVLGSGLMVFAGLSLSLLPTLATFNNWLGGNTAENERDGWVGWVYYSLVVFIGTIGVISPSGNEVGPFMALEQSVLSNFIPAGSRAILFAWYNLIGYVATAIGSLASGLVISCLSVDYSFFSIVYSVTMLCESPSLHIDRDVTAATTPFSKLESYRVIIGAYGVVGIFLAVAFSNLSSNIEPERTAESVEGGQSAAQSERTPLLNTAHQISTPSRSNWLPGLNLSPESRYTVAKLCFLFTLDSFAGSVITGSILAYWFNQKYNVDEAYLGSILFVSNILAGISSLLAGWVSGKVGLVNTMVFTHLPSNVLMIMVPLMPNLFWSTAILFLRYSISQMDVGPRQAYVASIVQPSERTAVIGLTNIVKSLGSAFGPTLAGWMMERGYFDYCFFVCGGLKIVYDLLLLWSFGGHARESAALSRGS